MQNNYPSKLLLFGEYLVLQQGAALAIPDDRHQTKWVRKEESNAEMLEYLEYLKSNELTKSHLNLDRLEKHLKNGWQLESDIPRHMGLGSSASFVAAIYDRYKTVADSEMPMEELQQIFATMEDFMHGKSSGFDPMPIYFRQPVLRKNNQSVLINNPISCLENWELELVDSGGPRGKNQWINKFLKKVEADEEFKENIKTLTKVNNKMVEAVIKNERSVAENLLTTFSNNQFHLFENWIPDSIKDQWEATNSNPGSVMKILGAGGGGYFLRIHFH